MFDAILLLSYGAPESPEQIDPFLNAILAGRRIPSARVAAVRARYESLGGRSPLAGECRAFLEQLRAALRDRADAPGVYWGNLFAPPSLEDAFQATARDGRREALVFVSSAFGAGGVCLRYRVDAARGAEQFPIAPRLTFAPPFFDCQPYRRALADAILETLAWDELDDQPFDCRRPDERLILFTAHSTPVADAAPALYPEQLATACNLVLRDILNAPGYAALATPHDRQTRPNAPFPPYAGPDALDSQIAPELLHALRDHNLDAALAFQSRSGAPTVPWLEPDANRLLQEYKKRRPALKRVIVAPIGFFFENMETVYDLDVELRATCDALGLTYRRAKCVGATERVAKMVADMARLDRAALPQCNARGAQCDFSCRVLRGEGTR